MEKVKYNIAIQTYMEVFDYLLTNNFFVYNSDRDFLSSRIKIDEYGFVEETQVRRGVWDAEHPNQKRVPALRVLKIITDIIDDLLLKANVPTSPDSRYAYIHDLKAKMNGQKSYYSSYQELLKIFKQVYNGQELMYSSDGKIVDFALLKYKQVADKFSKMTPLEKRTVECYAKLEEEIINYTANLLLVDEYGYPLDNLHRRTYDGTHSDVKFTSKETPVDWQEFKDCILDNYEYQKEAGTFNLHGVYSPLDSNQYKSELGLDGKTR
jgi:hypothetical protein